MEGPELRRSPRTLLSCPIELRVNERTIVLEKALGSLNAKGLYLHAGALPLDAPVHIKIAGFPPMEAKGVVRACDACGVWIEFATRTEAERQSVDNVIAELTRRETHGS